MVRVALAVLTGVGCAPAFRPSSAAATRAPGGEPAGVPVAPGGIVAGNESLHPGLAGVANYGSAAAIQLMAQVPTDPLRPALVDQIRHLARKARRPEPVGDARLDAVANDIARGMQGTDLPPFEVVDFLLGHYGLVEAAPNLLLARASSDADRDVREKISDQISAILATSHVAQVGIGVWRTATTMAVVVALQEKNVDLAPVPRTLAMGGGLTVEGVLMGGHKRPEVIVTAPDGQTREIGIASDAGMVKFRTTVRCDRGAGRYQIEVTGDDAFGTAVVANFPVFCGTSPPADAPRAAATRAGPSTMTAPEAEARLLELVNRDRRIARLPPVSVDRKLSDVARAHSRDMDEHDFVGHVSPTTGNALDRVRRGGFDPLLLLENVGRAYSPDEVEAGLMSSPGHRANLLDRRVSHIGIGIVIGKLVTGTSPLLVTQLFM